MSFSFFQRVRGCLFGQARADALGVGTEFMTKDQIRNAYPKFPYSFSEIVSDCHRDQWKKGDWTDDTDQSIVLLRCALRNRTKTPLEIANLFAKDLLSWAKKGLDPHITGDICGTGVGRPVAWVLREESFETNPQKAARDIWELSDGSLAEDGALMRTAFLACLPDPLERICEIAIECCRVTHADDRCLATVLFTTIVIYHILRNEDFAIDDIQKISETVMNRKKKCFKSYFRDIEIEFANLSEPVYRCHTRSPFKALIWTLRNATSYEKGIWKIIAEGGDADTNAAVSGAFLGALFPNEVSEEGLLHKNILEDLIQEIKMKHLEKG